VSTTASTYINAINQNFPVAGQNNDSQGFRDNFFNIKSALSATNIEVVNLQISTMQQHQSNDFNGYDLKNANLVNPTVNIATVTNSHGAVTIDYTQANFWPITLVNSGDHVIKIDNLPTDQRSGSLIVSATPSGLYTRVLFTATTGTVVSLGPMGQPYDLTNPIPYLFQIWNDYSGTIPYIYVKKITEETAEGSYPNEIISVANLAGNTAVFDKSVTLGNTEFSTGTVSGSVGATVVTDGTHYGNIALVPNRVNTAVTNVNTFPAGGSGTEISVLNPTGIHPGASFYFLGTNTQYTVQSVAGNIVKVNGNISVSTHTPPFPITFVNPEFSTLKKVVTLSNNKAADDYGTPASGTEYNLKGTVYADEHTLQVTFADPNGVTPNTFSVSKAVTTSTTATNDLATVGYIHSIMPEHSVIMWYGSQYSLPHGWVLCDGNVAPNGVTTPNLSNQFVIGATGDAAGPGPGGVVPATDVTTVQTISGGTSTSVLVMHDHTGTGTTTAVYDPGHQHLGVGANVISGSVPQPNGPFIGPNGSPNGPNGETNWGFTEYTSANASQWWTSKEYIFADQYGATPAAGGVILETQVTVNSTGTNNGAFANLPPYTALYYIYKWLGPIL
jgi:hypothetical protein